MVMGGTVRATIPAVFVTLSDGARLVGDIQGAGLKGAAVIADIGLRHVPWMDPGAFFIWAIGCAAAGIAAWRSAQQNRCGCMEVMCLGDGLPVLFPRLVCPHC